MPLDPILEGSLSRHAPDSIVMPWEAGRGEKEESIIQRYVNKYVKGAMVLIFLNALSLAPVVRR